MKQTKKMEVTTMSVEAFPDGKRSDVSSRDDMPPETLELEQYVPISTMISQLRGNDHPLHICEIVLEIARQAESLESQWPSNAPKCERIRQLCRHLLDELVSENFHVLR